MGTVRMSWRTKYGWLASRRVQIDEIDEVRGAGGEIRHFGKIDLRLAIAAFASVLGARKIDENLPHETGGEGKEVQTIGLEKLDLKLDDLLRGRPSQLLVNRKKAEAGRATRSSPLAHT